MKTIKIIFFAIIFLGLGYVATPPRYRLLFFLQKPMEQIIERVENYKFYHHQKHDFGLQHPPTWEVKEEGESYVIFQEGGITKAVATVFSVPNFSIYKSRTEPELKAFYSNSLNQKYFPPGIPLTNWFKQAQESGHEYRNWTFFSVQNADFYGKTASRWVFVFKLPKDTVFVSELGGKLAEVRVFDSPLNLSKENRSVSANIYFSFAPFPQESYGEVIKEIRNQIFYNRIFILGSLLGLGLVFYCLKMSAFLAVKWLHYYILFTVVFPIFGFFLFHILGGGFHGPGGFGVVSFFQTLVSPHSIFPLMCALALFALLILVARHSEKMGKISKAERCLQRKYVRRVTVWSPALFFIIGLIAVMVVPPIGF